MARDTFRKARRELGPQQIDHIDRVKCAAELIENVLSAWPGREAALALTNLQQAVMWASMAVSE